MAKLVTVHLLLPLDDYIDIADCLTEFLGTAVADGVVLDWGYAYERGPTRAARVNTKAYEEGDFYKQLGLPEWG